MTTINLNGQKAIFSQNLISASEMPEQILAQADFISSLEGVELKHVYFEKENESSFKMMYYKGGYSGYNLDLNTLEID